MRFHTQTAGVSLTAQQPLNNIVRTAIEALAGVLGGTQSLHTNSYDEALALPTEEAVRIALRTQQIIAHETGVDEHDRPARRRVLRRGADRPAGGARLRVLRARSTSSAAWSRRSSAASRSGRSPTPRSSCSARSTAGGGSSSASTRYTEGDEAETDLLRIDPALERKQIEPCSGDPSAARDATHVERALARRSSRPRAGERNLMPLLIDAARPHVSEGEIVEALQEVWGDYREQPVF